MRASLKDMDRARLVTEHVTTSYTGTEEYILLCYQVPGTS